MGSCAYAVAEGAIWRASMADKPKEARRFCAVMAEAMIFSVVLDHLGFNAVKMPFLLAVNK